VVGAGASGLIQGTGVIIGNSGVVLANNTPGVTTNTLYNVGGDLYFNGSQLASGGGASATATYASGQALSLTYASGLTPNIATNTAIANYASGQALSLTYASGLTVTNSAIANYASGQSLSLTHASGLTATNAGNITTVTATANYASGQALSLATASGIAAYSSGVVTGGIANLNKLGINTGSPAYGIDVVGAGASGIIQASGVKLGASGIIFSNGTTQTVAGAPATVTLTAGDGLTGGGTLASDRTFTVNVDDSTIETDSDAIRVKDNGITLAKMAGLARGKIIYGDTNGDPAALTAGGANTVLTSDGTDVSWASVPVNSYVSGVAAYASGQVNATAGTATASKALILDSNKSFTGIADGSFQKIGVGTTSPQYGLQLVGAGTSGVIQSSGILIGASGIGVGTTTPVYPIDVVQHSGVVRASGMHSAISMNADAATVTFDLDQATTHGVTLGGGRTLALSNVQIGDKFLIRLQQDATGSRTVTWFDHISWAGGSAPTLTTTANKADLFGFLTASGTGGAYWFDGLVVGQNI
jgi:hypothetical protein